MGIILPKLRKGRQDPGNSLIASPRDSYASFNFALMAGPVGAIVLVSASFAPLESATREWPFFAVAAGFWIVVYAAAAGLLICATVLTFDRCLGRMPEHGGGPRADPKSRGGKPKPKPAAAIAQER
jgi:hypothetical protein